MIQTVQNREVLIAVYKLATDEKVLDISGNCLSGSITINAEGDVRRTGSIELIVKNSTIINNNITEEYWMDKYIQVIMNGTSLMGSFVVDTPNYRYDATNHTLTLSFLDFTALLNGTRRGYIEKAPVLYKAEENIKQAIIATLQQAGIKKYRISPSDGPLPADLSFQVGATYSEVLKGIKDVYPSYEMFFDVDGTFVYQKIPDFFGADGLKFRDWKDIVISEESNFNYQNVKNAVRVYGRTHKPNAFATTAVIEGGYVDLTVPSVIEYIPDIMYGFTVEENLLTDILEIRVNELPLYPVYTDAGTIPVLDTIKENSDNYFCVQFKGDHWRWLGHLQATGYAENIKAGDPFAISSGLGKVYLPLTGGEYDNCVTDDLAYQRAKHELWMHTDLNDVITLSCVPYYDLDVNEMTQYQSLVRPKDANNKWFITNISHGLGYDSTMQVTLTQFKTKEVGEEWQLVSNQSFNDILSNGEIWVGTSSNNTGISYSTSRTPAPVNWDKSNITTGNFGRIVYGNGLWMTYSVNPSDHGVYYSTDGRNWTHQTSVYLHVKSINYSADSVNHWVACGSPSNPGGFNNNSVYLSTDGINWRKDPFGSAQYTTVDIAYGAGKWIAIGTDADSGNMFLTFPDTGAPGKRLINDRNLHNIAFHDGVWVIAGDDYLWNSKDGVRWSPGDYGVGGFHNLKYVNNQWFVSKVSYPVVLSSLNGVTWWELTGPDTESPGSMSMNDIGYSNGTWIAGGKAGYGLMYSVDSGASTWYYSNIRQENIKKIVPIPGRRECVALGNSIWVSSPNHI